MDDPIITTREAAALLGVSIRTAQSWVEHGALESWKTPGGHRRVRRSAVLALRATVASTEAVPQRMVFLISKERLGLYREVLSSIDGYSTDIEFTTYSTMMAVGASAPTVLLVELLDDTQHRLKMVSTVTEDSRMDSVRVLAVTGPRKGRERLRRHLAARTEILSISDIRTELPAALRLEVSQPRLDSAQRNPGFPFPTNETDRAAAVSRSGLLDSPTDATFDNITWLASQMLNIPISLITLLSPDRQWFKSRHGFGIKQTPRSWAFCNYAILEEGVFVVEDANSDPRFSTSPLVNGKLGIRFYAGVALKDEKGFSLGTLCVMDKTPRVLDKIQLRLLHVLASLTEDKIRLRNRTRQAEWFISKTRRHF